MSPFRKIGVSVPHELGQNLDYLSTAFGVSRSQIVVELLAGPLCTMVEIVGECGVDAPPEVYREAGLKRLTESYEYHEAWLRQS